MKLINKINYLKKCNQLISDYLLIKMSGIPPPPFPPPPPPSPPMMMMLSSLSFPASIGQERIDTIMTIETTCRNILSDHRIQILAGIVNEILWMSFCEWVFVNELSEKVRREEVEGTEGSRDDH